MGILLEPDEPWSKLPYIKPSIPLMNTLENPSIIPVIRRLDHGADVGAILVIPETRQAALVLAQAPIEFGAWVVGSLGLSLQPTLSLWVPKWVYHEGTM